MWSFVPNYEGKGGDGGEAKRTAAGLRHTEAGWVERSGRESGGGAEREGRDEPEDAWGQHFFPFQIWDGESLAPCACLIPGLEDSVSMAQFLSCMSSD